MSGCLLLVLLSPSNADSHRCWYAKDCALCLQTGPSCAWCSQTDFQAPRCASLETLRGRGCEPAQLSHPQASLELLRHTEVTRPSLEVSGSSMEVPQSSVGSGAPRGAEAQLEPRRFSLRLRPGEAWSFSLLVSPSREQPVDIYYLLDLSPSMRNHLESISQLGPSLARQMANITEDLRLGFGLIETRLGAQVTQFRHVLSLTSDLQSFADAVSLVQSQSPGEQEVRGLQGAVDALLQVSVCQEEIGWRNGTRLLVYTANQRRQGDFVAGSQVKKCQLQNGVYSPSGSPQHVNAKRTFQTVTASDIAVLLAVPEDLLKDDGRSSRKDFIERAQKLIAHCSTGTLSRNCDNLGDLTVKALSGRGISLQTSAVPQGVALTYHTRCMDGLLREGREGAICRNASAGHQVAFNVSLAVTRCHSQDPPPQTITIQPLGFSEQLDIELKPICSCDCQRAPEENSAFCHGNGAFECGVCRCNAPFIGKRCEIPEMEDSLVDHCRSHAESPVCSRHGDCVGGVCVCHRGVAPWEFYSGRFCECDNFSCDHHNNQVCGGHGRCECGVCVCNSDWTGSACGCSMEVSSCMASNQLICNNKGACVCGSCDCDSMYSGSTCEDELDLPAS